MEKRAHIPKSYRANYDKAMRGRSMKAAIKAFCLECVNYQRSEVRDCTNDECPLFKYRPYKN